MESATGKLRLDFDWTSCARALLAGTPALVACLVLLVTAGCVGDEEGVVSAPIHSDAVLSVHFDAMEDETLQGTVASLDSQLYFLAQDSQDGRVSLDRSTGQFTFTPNANFFGETGFTYFARTGMSKFERGVVSITVIPVNDPPQIQPIADVPNSPDEFVQTVQITAHDVDGDVRFTAISEQTNVVGYELDAVTGKLQIYPRSEGVAVFRVMAADDQYSDEEEFRFVVGRVTRRNTIPAQSLAEETVEVINPLDVPVTFRLNVNDRLFPGSIPDILARFSKSTLAGGSKPSDRTLPIAVWEGLVSSLSRGYTLTDRVWLHDPVVLLNSVGVAYCDDVAGAYYALLEEAGYPSRVWTLNGHVVPEVFENGAWRLYDPDMGVYYLRSDGEVAGVEDLAASPELITDPLGGEFLPARVGDSFPYSDEVADIFASENDNIVWDYYMTLPEERTFGIELPPGGSLSFPGGWSAPPPDLAGRLPPEYANLKVRLPANWAGSFSVPLVLLDIRGYGIVEIDGQEFAIGSAQLKAAIDSRIEFIDQVTIKSADSAIELIYMLNPQVVSADNRYLVELEGVKVAALQLSRAVLDEQYSLRN